MRRRSFISEKEWNLTNPRCGNTHKFTFLVILKCVTFHSDSVGNDSHFYSAAAQYEIGQVTVHPAEAHQIFLLQSVQLNVSVTTRSRSPHPTPKT